ncbi:unnamed protein product [Withania somnifera]
MAAQEDPPQPLNYKIWVLKVSIHCEGCKRKVKKILQQVPGVYAIDIDLKQQKATVTGNVEAEALLRKLHKSGKHAELVPQPSDHKEKKPAKSKNKEKEMDSLNRKEASSSTSQPVSSIDKDVKSAAKFVIPKEPSLKIQHAKDEVPKSSEKTSAGSAKPKEETGTTSVDEPAVAKEISDQTVKESKSEGKKLETDSDGKQQIPAAAAEKKDTDGDHNASASGQKNGGGPVGQASGVTGKKKKKKGKDSNNTEGTPSSIVTPAGAEFEYNNMDPQISAPTNDIHPRQPADYPQQVPQFYAQSAAYVVSYNTAQPTSSYTASYYAPAPPTSYAYTYSGPVVEPPPSDVDMYPRQSLDSFEMFSDENPNGCFIM